MDAQLLDVLFSDINELLKKISSSLSAEKGMGSKSVAHKISDIVLRVMFRVVPFNTRESADL